jgi:hypothetical protein
MRLAIIFLILTTSLEAQCVKPTITNATAVSDSTGQQLTVSWTTSVPADSMIMWGYLNAGTPTPVTDASGVTTHSVTVTGLMPAQTYSWGIRSQAINGGVGCGDGYIAYKVPPNIVTMTAAPAGPFTYAITPVGPTYVTQGYGVYIGVKEYTLTGTYAPNGLKLVVSGLPPFTSVVWPDATTDTGGYWNVGGNVASTTTVGRDTITVHDYYPFEFFILTNAGGTTPAGDYTLTITGSQNNGSGYPTVTATWPLHVVTDAFSGVAFPYGAPDLYPPIPGLSTFMASADTYGQQNCGQDEQPGYRVIRANNKTAAAISTLTRSNNVTTATTVSRLPTGPLGINSANQVRITGASDSTFDTPSTVTITVTGASTFTYPNTGANATTSGGTVTNQLTPVAPCCTYQTWFYDGVQVYHNVENLLKNGRDWAQCRTNVKQVYRDNYALQAPIHVFMEFSKGYFNDYPITNDAADLTLLNKFTTDSWVQNPVHGGFVDVSYLERELSYTLRNFMHAEKMGVSSPFGSITSAQFRDFSEDHVLGMIDQIVLSPTVAGYTINGYNENFMNGIMAMELIDYYELVAPDPRIPPAIKALADWMWTNQWQTNDSGSFPYDKFQFVTHLSMANGGSCMNTLNQMISPMYAWLFKMTGSTTYLNEGDTIFQHGALFDCPSGPTGPAAFLTFPGFSDGKNYSQQYSWGYDYVVWRSAPRAAPHPPSGLSAIVSSPIR